MKLEPGKTYRTRDGRVAKVIAEWDGVQGMFHCDDKVPRRADGTVRDWNGERVPEADFVAPTHAMTDVPADYQTAALMTIKLDGVAVGSYAWRSTDGCWRAVMADGTILTDTDRNELERRMIECASK